MPAPVRSTLENRYFERMAAALGDKARLADALVPGSVADVGAGGGELSALFAARDGISGVYAIDDAPDALARLRDLSGVTAVAGSVAQLPGLAPLDNIVFCSVLHEVYSYAGGYPAVAEALDLAAASLRSGGRLIIRNGVMPERPGEPATLTAPDDELVTDYLALTPHRELALAHAGPGAWIGTRHAVAEAVLTLTWGRDSLPRESQERYQLDTLDGYRHSVVTGRSLRLLRARSYVQPEYVRHLADYTLIDPASGHWFPPTNAVWVYEKSA
ncbi:methyltransferase domain-containing protein [Microbacterium sp. KR10-403]|uniref:methyltransferase domain-containing protein n=1 Tax=Microbacterium sp. KR10-403 TaxID=3158581 RepID=UPI0032E3AE5B